MAKKRLSLFISLLLALVLVFSGIQEVFASALVHPEVVQAAIDGTHYGVQTIKAGDYVEATNSFSDGSPSYYLVTSDPAKASWGAGSVLSYKGVPYTLTDVLHNISNINLMTSGGVSIFKPNATVFLDPGTYSDSDATAYTRYNHANLSVVGVEKNASGEPSAKILKLARSGSGVPAIDGTNERIVINTTNIYFENLIFDGNGLDMYPVGGTGTPNIPKSRGEYFFMVSGTTAGFVLRDSIIQNVGAVTTDDYAFGVVRLYNKNVGINFYRTTGPNHVENVKFRNMKTTAPIYSGMALNGYGIISSNQANHNYFRNISIVADGAYHPNSFSIKIEHTAVDLVPVSNNYAVFDGTLSLPADMNHNHIYIQDYAYEQSKVPADFRYVMYASQNGGNDISAMRVYNVFPTDLTPVALGPGATLYFGVMDLADNSWLVQGDNARSTTDQIKDVKMVFDAMNGLATQAPIKIKLSTNADGDIAYFSVENAILSAGNFELVAVANKTDLWSSRAMVPFKAGELFHLFGSASLPVRAYVYNIDFHAKANYSLHEVIQGIDPAAVTPTDPNEDGTIAGYPVYSTYAPAAAQGPKSQDGIIAVDNYAIESMYANCRFTSLVAKIKFTSALTEVQAGETITLTAALTATNDDSYTDSTYTTDMMGTADDQVIQFYSRNPDIATVDLNTGVVTGIMGGEATICAKARDTFNQGEIEKPWVCQIITVIGESALNVVKTQTSTGPYRVGDTITFTIVATNTGTNILHNVNVTDIKADTLTCTPAVPVANFAPGAVINCDGTRIATLPDFEAGDYTNTATATSDELPPAEDVIVIPLTTCDPSLVKTVNPTSVPSGEEVEYNFVVTHAGKNAVDDLVLEDNFPAGFEARSITILNAPVGTTPIFTPPLGAGAVPYSLKITFGPGIQPGAVIIVKVRGIVTGADGTVIENTGKVSTNQAGDNPTNNISKARLRIGAPLTGDSAITKTVLPAELYSGETAVFTLTVTHSGQRLADDIVVRDMLPYGLNVQSVSLQNEPADTTVTVEPPPNSGPGPYAVMVVFGHNVAPGTVTTIKITAIVNGAAGTSITNTANLQTTGAGEDPANNQSSATLRIRKTTPATLPATGFPQGIVSSVYGANRLRPMGSGSGMSIAIPRLGLDTTIWSVPAENKSWNVSWLTGQVGWLEGSAWPTEAGNSILTGHLYTYAGTPGPFVNLKTLRYGDKVSISQGGQVYTYEVRSVALVNADDLRSIKDDGYSWINLVTCASFDQQTGTYLYRTLVRAVLISVK